MYPSLSEAYHSTLDSQKWLILLKALMLSLQCGINGSILV